MVSVSTEHIAKTPGICGVKACVAGHRIRVMDIVIQYEKVGLSPAQIVSDVFPSITLADVHAAIAYYLDHRDEIAADFRHDEEMAEKYRSMFPSKLKGKLVG
ncbi:MAG TPA: DUF433 domain-containing protein [Gemmata sp.]|nr:DUF433 domain-containing protein [Gemmata sp.]